MSGSVPLSVAEEAARSFKTLVASGAHAPVVSATVGMNVTPASAHKPSVFRKARLWSEYAEAAANRQREASWRVSCFCGAVMAKSSAAGEPLDHDGRKASAGRRR